MNPKRYSQTLQALLISCNLTLGRSDGYPVSLSILLGGGAQLGPEQNDAGSSGFPSG